MTSDLDLLGRFARENSQEAFSEIVRRHLDLVYSAALRQVRSPQLAEEIAQSVFADLARDAGRISGTGVPPVSSLTPWLYAVTRRTAIDVVRKESRRQLREQIAIEMTNMNATTNDWMQIEPLLDDAMVALDETDRSAILLRYFENKSLHDVGESLKISDDAAQKRVSRAVERLREFFTKRNVTIGASGLVVLISANAVQSAPIALATAISAAVLAGTAVKSSTVMAATKIIAMTTLQKTLLTATVAVLAGAGIYEAHQNSLLRYQVQTLRQQPAPLTGQVQQLQRERDAAANQLAGLLAENEQLKSNRNETELLKLRSEVTQLQRMQSKEATDDPFTQSVLALTARAVELNQHLEQMPDKKIPELRLLDEGDWLTAAQNAKFDTDADIRKAFQKLRRIAKEKVPIGSALSAFAGANNGRLPNDLAQLKPYFNQSRLGDLGLDDSTFNAIIGRYTLLHTGNVNDFPSGTWFVVEKAPVDKGYDSREKFGLGTSSNFTTGIGEAGDPNDPSY
jgi:RNA polymerase sigma factor (sigma-70 family)